MKADVLKKYAPPGMSLKQEAYFFIIGSIISFLYSLSFIARYIEERRRLYLVINGKRVLNEEAVMADFSSLMEFSLIGFAIVAVGMLGFAVYHYTYYRQGSMSIYLMKRLPKRSELHKRNLTLPLTAMIICIIAAFILMLIYFAIYMLATPDQCLSPDQWQKIWGI